MATLDPRDPRAAGDDQPPDDTGWNAPLPPIRRSDEELTRDYGPVAPEPRWEKPEPYYNRERFLLRLVAWIIGVQFSVYIAGTVACGEIARVKLNLLLNQSNRPPDPAPFCVQLPDKLQNSVDQGLAILLALLGGSALAGSERRQPPRSDPRRGGGDRQP